MLAKQRLERQKKEHDEMLERGEKALQLTEQLEASLAVSEQISATDRARLESLEDLVEKIRKDLGGRDDDDEKLGQDNSEANPSNLKDGFKFLKSTTVALVEELRKTTRFSVSAAAIQTSNNVLKIVRWLRLRN